MGPLFIALTNPLLGILGTTDNNPASSHFELETAMALNCVEEDPPCLTCSSDDEGPPCLVDSSDDESPSFMKDTHEHDKPPQCLFNNDHAGENFPGNNGVIMKWLGIQDLTEIECRSVALKWFRLPEKERIRLEGYVRVYSLNPYLFGRINARQNLSPVLHDPRLFDERYLHHPVPIINMDHINIVERGVDSVILHLANSVGELQRSISKINKSIVNPNIEAAYDDWVVNMKNYLDVPNILKAWCLREYIELVWNFMQNNKDYEAIFTPSEAENKEICDLKNKGNEKFKDKKYKEAIELYSKAIIQYPYSHILYGNRSQAFMNTGQYHLAAADGRRAMVLKPDWDKGYYRYALAMFQLGFNNEAIRANKCGQEKCINITTLKEQLALFIPEEDSPEDDVPPLSDSDSETESTLKSKEKKESGYKRNKAHDSAPIPILEEVNQLKQTKEHMRNGSQALVGGQFNKAAGCYQKAMSWVRQNWTPDNLNDLGVLEVIILKYALGYVLTTCSNDLDILSGIRLFEDIIQNHKVSFPLAYYGLIKAYLAQNRFKMVQDPARTGLQMLFKTDIKKELTWPQIMDVIPESSPTVMRDYFQKAIAEARFPPKAHAVCILPDCLSHHYKSEIYHNDPDFKGYVQIACFAKCLYSYHLDCWKKYKLSANDGSHWSDKDILNGGCLTPNCDSPIKYIDKYNAQAIVITSLEGEAPPKVRRVHKKLPMISDYKKTKKKIKKELRKRKHSEYKLGTNNESDNTGLELIEQLQNASSSAAVVDMSKKEGTHLLRAPGQSDEVDDKYSINPKVKKKKNKEMKKMKKRSDQLKITHEIPPTPIDGAMGLDSFSPPKYSSIRLNEDNPFSIPPELQNDIEKFNQVSAPSLSEISEQPSLGMRNVYKILHQVLSECGPLPVDSSILVNSIASNCSMEEQALIAEQGGIVPFLSLFPEFSHIDGVIVCLKKDLQQARACRESNENSENSPHRFPASSRTLRGDGMHYPVDSACGQHTSSTLNPYSPPFQPVVPEQGKKITDLDEFHLPTKHRNSNEDCAAFSESCGSWSSSLTGVTASGDADYVADSHHQSSTAYNGSKHVPEGQGDCIAGPILVGESMKRSARALARHFYSGMPLGRDSESSQSSEEYVSCDYEQSPSDISDTLLESPTKTSPKAKVHVDIKTGKTVWREEDKVSPAIVQVPGQVVQRNLFSEEIDKSVQDTLNKYDQEFIEANVREVYSRIAGETWVKSDPEGAIQRIRDRITEDVIGAREFMVKSTSEEPSESVGEPAIDKSVQDTLDKNDQECIEANVREVFSLIAGDTWVKSDPEGAIQRIRDRITEDVIGARVKSTSEEPSESVSEPAVDDIEEATRVNENDDEEQQYMIQYLRNELKTARDEREHLSQEKERQISQLMEELRLAREALDVKQDQLESKTAEVQQKDLAVANLMERLSKERIDRAAEMERVKSDFNATAIAMQQQMERAIKSEVALLELKCCQGKDILERSREEAMNNIRQLEMEIVRIKGNGNSLLVTSLEGSYRSWQDYLRKVKTLLNEKLKEFEEQIRRVRLGEELSTLPPLEISLPPSPPSFPVSYPDMATSAMSNPMNDQEQVHPGPSKSPSPVNFPVRMNSPVRTVRPTKDSRKANLTDGASGGMGIQNLPQQTYSEKAAGRNGNNKVRMGVHHLPSQLTTLPIRSRSPSERNTRALNPAMSVGPSMPPPEFTKKPVKNRSSHEQIIDTLLKMFPEHNKLDFQMKLIELRKAGSFSGMSKEEVISAVASKILDNQSGAVMNSQQSNASAAAAHSMSHGSGELEEDPCVICHEELAQSGAVLTLECAHRFHNKCIKKWLSGNKTCPTCRTYVVLDEEFPALG